MIKPETRLLWRQLALAGVVLLTIGHACAGTHEAKAHVITPSPVPAFTMVAAGDAHFAALGRDGSVWVWGDNQRGQLGLGSDQEIAALAMGVQIKRDQPQRLGDGFVFIGAHGSSTMAVKSDGSLWGWGTGVPGLEIRKTYLRPTRVTWMRVKEVHPGSYFAFVRDRNDALWRFGNPGDSETADIPVPSYFTDSVKQIAVHDIHAAVLLGDGTLWTYGSTKDSAVLGRAAVGDYPSFLQVGTDDVLSAATDALLTILKKNDGSTGIFGEQRYLAPLLSGVAASQYRAVFHYRHQVAGTLHVYLLKENGELDLVQVEHDDEGAKPLPVRTVGRDFVSVSSSYNLLIGLKGNGSVWVWGSGYGGVPGAEDWSETIVVPQAVSFSAVTKGAQQ